jgi:hypothetical protein
MQKAKCLEKTDALCLENIYHLKMIVLPKISTGLFIPLPRNENPPEFTAETA